MNPERWRKPKHEEQEDWLMSYADMITLLLSLFVLLLSMAKIDPVKFEQVESGMAREIGKRNSQTPIENLRQDLTEAIKGMKLNEDQVTLGTDDRGLVLELDGTTFFESGQARLRQEMLPPLVKMAELLSSPRYTQFMVSVQGHTDDMPSNNPAFPTNWELSAARAAIVVRMLIQHNVEPIRLSAEGFADTRPRVSNRDMNGKPLPANQALNRRVTIHMFPR